METTNPEQEVVEQSTADRLAALYAEDTEPEEGTPEPEAEAVEEEAAPEEEAEAEEATEVVEFEGKQYALPKELKDAVLRQKDYTQKTQEVAEKRKAIEERERAIEHIEKAREAMFEKAVKLRTMEQQLQQFNQLDWDTLYRQDQAEAMRLDRAHRQLQQEHAKERQEIAQAYQQVTQTEEQSYQQAIAKTREAVSKQPWWSPQVDEQVGKFADTVGLTQVQKRAIASDPTVYSLLHDAMKWRDLQASKPGLTKKVAEAKPMKVASRTAADTQANAAYTQARDRLRKTGKGAEEALAAIYERTRKR